jgi:hypothetical protein
MQNKVHIQFSPTRLKQIKKIALSGSKAKLKILNGKLEEGFYLLKHTAQKLKSFATDLAYRIPQTLAGKISLDLFSHFESKSSKRLGIPKGIVLGGILALMVSLPAVGQTTTYDVTTTSDIIAADGFTSLREAINSANADLTSSSILLDDGLVYILTGSNLPTITNDFPLSIISTGTLNAVIDGDNTHRPLTMDIDSDLTISKITVQNGFVANGDGGGIYNHRGHLTISNSLVINNAVTGVGIEGRGGGIYSTGQGGNASVLIQSSSISLNTVAYQGGGVFNFNSDMTISSSSFSGNTSSNRGGGVLNFNNSPLIISNSSFSGNTSGLQGGAVCIFRSDMTISSSSFSGNTSNRGGGVFNFNSDMAIQVSSFSGNTAVRGGGIYSYTENNDNDATIINTTISGNETSGVGGGIYTRSTGTGNTLTLQHVTLFENIGVGTDGFANDATSTLDITVQNTIIDDCGGTGVDFSLGGATLNGASTNNIVQDGSMAGASAVHSILNGLTLNSGFLVNAMPIGSPAIAGGANLGITTDQLGNPRGATPSIGAVETTAPAVACIVVSAPAGVTITWLGCIDTDWNNPSNWSANCTPKENDVVYIPVGTTNNLIIDEVATCAKMLVQIGTKCTVNYNAGGKLLVKF